MAWRSPPIFTSSSRLLFDQSSPTGAVIAPESYLTSQAELLQSTSVLNAAALKLEKLHLKVFAGSDDLYGPLQKGLGTKTGVTDGTVTVAFSGPYPQDNSTVVNSVVEVYQQVRAEQNPDLTQQKLADLRHQKENLQADLASQKRDLERFSKASGTSDAGGSAGLLAAILPQKQELDKFSSRLSDAQVAEMALAAKYDSLLAQSGALPVTLVASNTTSGSAGAKLASASDDSDVDPAWLENELSLAAANLELLKSRGLNDDNSSVQDAKAAVAHLRKSLAEHNRKQGLAALAECKTEMELARQRKADLQAAVDAKSKAVVALEAKRAELADLEISSRKTSLAVDQVDSQIRQLQTDAIVPMGMHILEPAQAAVRPNNRRPRMIGLAGGGGIVAGLAISVGLCAVDRRLQSTAEIRTLLNIPILAVIPALSSKLSLSQRALLAHSDPMCQLADAARTVRSAIFFAAKTRAAGTVLITSPRAGEGRSLFASNLAVVMAQSGSRTLLLDADFRNPGVESIFEIPRPTGLSDVLSQKLALDRAVHRTAVDRLEVLGCGTIPDSPRELLNSGGFSRLLEQLQCRYQCIVIDCPGLETEADARILSASTDLTVFLVRAAATSRSSAKKALEQLLSVGGRVLGCVVNDAQLCESPHRSRGVLQFIESRGNERGGSDVSVYRDAQESGMNPSERAALTTMHQRMESDMVTEVEVVQ